MTHYSQVADSVFTQIAEGQKIIEPRINDAAHKRVRIGDLLVIINRTTRAELVAKVVGILRYPDFETLFAAFPPRYFGVDNIDEVRQEVTRWYNPTDASTHGVLGIKLHVLRAK